MPKIQIPEEDPVCVLRERSWCATRKRTTSYEERIKTVCGVEVMYPSDINRCEPDCPDCLRIMGLSKWRKSR